MSIFEVALDYFIDMNHESEVQCNSKGMEHEKYEFGNKSAITKPVIGHLKSDHRTMRNYLKGIFGDVINTLMAATVYNMRHWVNKNALSSFVSWLKTLLGHIENVESENEKQMACRCPALTVVT